MKVKTIHFVKQEGSPVYVQVYEAIKEDILRGYLHYGDQLPSIRHCANQLSLSRTSIEAAYQRLLLEGYIIAKAQKGYFVDVDEKNADLRKQILAKPKIEKVVEKEYDLRSSSIDATSFDTTIWMHYLKEVLQDEHVIMAYGDPQGEKELRVALQKYMYSMRGVLSQEEQIIVGASFQSLLYLICSLYEGKKVVGMEVGGFPQAEQVFQDCGFRIVMLKQDERGICMEDLYKQEIGILYVNSASCGSEKKALRSNRRSALLQYAKQKQILVLEDDHNGELRYRSKMRPAMQGFDRGQQVVYIRSFSKLLLPSLRMSFMVLNASLSKRYAKRKTRYNPSASKMEQLALARYISDGHLERQVRRLKKRYEKKSELMMDALQKEFPDMTMTLDESALQIILHLKSSIDIDAYIQCAKEHHILLQKSALGNITLSFAAIAEQEIVPLIHQLKEVWANMEK